MTDIVIKPSNSGGSVKLQTEGGTNGLTMASTGVLTTSGNVAVTGTMTGGTLGSGVTFPAGHIIQIVTNIPSTVTQATTTTTSFAEIQTAMRTEITPKFANSLLVLEFSCMHGGNNSSNILSQNFYDITNSSDIHATLPGEVQEEHDHFVMVHQDKMMLMVMTEKLFS